MNRPTLTLPHSFLAVALLLPLVACDDRADESPASASQSSMDLSASSTDPSPLSAVQATPAPFVQSTSGTSQPTSQPSTQPAPRTVLPTAIFPLNGHDFVLEIADEEEEQKMGLMFRNELAPDYGMIFVFQKEERRGFWMKNTYIPLDIIYVAANGKVVNILKMYPQDEDTYDSISPAMYAIELNAGTAKKIGLKTGDTIVIPDAFKPKR